MERIFQILKTLDFGTKNPARFTSLQIMNAFKQGMVHLPPLRKIGGGGNCASIAIIKAAIGTFGFENVFKSVIIDDKNQRFLIDLKDDDTTVYNLSFEDYFYGADKSAFMKYEQNQVSEDILEFSKFCFAVMAEVKRNEFRSFNTYKRAVTDLNKGESAPYIHTYLGLPVVDLENVSVDNLSLLENLVVWNGPHAVYSSIGFYDEAFSELHNQHIDPIQPLNGLKNIHGDGTTEYNPIGAQILSN